MRKLELRSYYLIHVSGGHSKGYERRRYMDVFEGSGHGVFSSDSCSSHIHLGVKGSQHSCKRNSPLLRILAQFLKVFLEGKIYVLELST